MGGGPVFGQLELEFEYTCTYTYFDGQSTGSYKLHQLHLIENLGPQKVKMSLQYHTHTVATCLIMQQSSQLAVWIFLHAKRLEQYPA